MLEIAENGDLLDYINTRRYLPEPEARFVFTQMSQAIGFCHERDIVHRDLKCENVMLNRGMDVKIGGKCHVGAYLTHRDFHMVDLVLNKSLQQVVFWLKPSYFKAQVCMKYSINRTASSGDNQDV